jgi:hypothetical protein
MLATNANWRTTIDYERLIAESEVRNLVARYSAQHTGGVSAEAILKLHDQFAPMLGGIKIESLANVVVPLFRQWGIGTGKSRKESIEAPAGHVLAGAICSLAYRGRKLQAVNQAQDGVMLVATLPSDAWSWEGTIAVGITNWHSCTDVEVTTKIGGQMFDWGKSTRCVEQVFADIRRFPEF